MGEGRGGCSRRVARRVGVFSDTVCVFHTKKNFFSVSLISSGQAKRTENLGNSCDRCWKCPPCAVGCRTGVRL